jgi:hypothetical protein
MYHDYTLTMLAAHHQGELKNEADLAATARLARGDRASWAKRLLGALRDRLPSRSARPILRPRV